MSKRSPKVGKNQWEKATRLESFRSPVCALGNSNFHDEAFSTTSLLFDDVDGYAHAAADGTVVEHPVRELTLDAVGPLRPLGTQVFEASAFHAYSAHSLGVGELVLIFGTLRHFRRSGYLLARVDCIAG